MIDRPYANLQNRRSRSPSAFIGVDHEHTAAYGRTTLFLVGRRTPKEMHELIESAQDQVLSIEPAIPALSHLYYGANWSFDGQSMEDWERVIEAGLREGFWCTLDFRPAHIPLVQMTGLCRHAKFIPVVSVRIPKVNTLGPNAALKIDDISFAGTNAGVWCHRFTELTALDTSKFFTPWTKYANDHIIEFTEEG